MDGGWQMGAYNQQGSTSSTSVDQIIFQLNQLYVIFQKFDPQWCQENPFWSMVNGRSGAQLCELHVNWTRCVEHIQAQPRVDLLVGDTIEPRMEEVNQGLDVNSETQQPSESFASDGLDGGIDVPSFPGVHNREQAETLHQGAGGDHGAMGNGQDAPAPVPPASLPSTNAQADAIGASSNISLPSWFSHVQPPPIGHVVSVRRECLITLEINLKGLLDLPGQDVMTWNGLVIPSTAGVRAEDYAGDRGVLHLSLRVFGADTNKECNAVCIACSKREGKKKGMPSLVDFQAASDIIKASDDGLVRVKFRFSCYPKHQNPNESAYLLEVVLLEKQPQGQAVNSPGLLATFRLPWHFKVGKRPNGPVACVATAGGIIPPQNGAENPCEQHPVTDDTPTRRPCVEAVRRMPRGHTRELLVQPTPVLSPSNGEHQVIPTPYPQTDIPCPQPERNPTTRPPTMQRKRRWDAADLGDGNVQTATGRPQVRRRLDAVENVGAGSRTSNTRPNASRPHPTALTRHETNPAMRSSGPSNERSASATRVTSSRPLHPSPSEPDSDTTPEPSHNHATRPQQCIGSDTQASDTSRVGNPASQSTEPSGPEALSSVESRDPTNSAPLGTSENTVPFVDNGHSTSPAEPLVPSQQRRQTVNTANVEETADGRDLVIDRTNPSRGPTTGGPEIWISGSNFPTGLTSLYVRFGDNFARAVPQKPDLLSCFLPQASGPGMVTVALSRSPSPNAPVLGTSLCRFEYFTDLNEMLPVIIRIQEDCTPEVAAALDILHKEMKKRNLKRNGKRPLRAEETRHDEIETAIIQALAPLQNTLDFGELISKTNDYKQTLAHFAVLFGYTNLLRRLVGWNIDLTIADFNGSTALHCAYKKGDRVCVDLLLEKGASETVLDALGRAPSHLMPEGFASLNDQNTDMTSDDQPRLEQKRDLFQSADFGHGVPDPGGEKSMSHAKLDDRMEQVRSSSAARNNYNSISISGTRAVDGWNDAPAQPLTIHPTIALAQSPYRTHLSDIGLSFILTAIVLAPQLQHGNFPYRGDVKARISLSGNSPLPFNVVVGPSHPNKPSVMRLLCHAECQSCKSRDLSAHKRCNPTAFFLDPVQDVRDNQGFAVDHTGDSFTLDRNVTFRIKHRPIRPTEWDQVWRCPSESLILTYLLCDDAGNTVARHQVDAPFQARKHAKHLRPAVPTAPSDSEGSNWTTQQVIRR